MAAILGLQSCKTTEPAWVTKVRQNILNAFPNRLYKSPYENATETFRTWSLNKFESCLYWVSENFSEFNISAWHGFMDYTIVHVLKLPELLNIFNTCGGLRIDEDNHALWYEIIKLIPHTKHKYIDKNGIEREDINPTDLYWCLNMLYGEASITGRCPFVGPAMNQKDDFTRAQRIAIQWANRNFIVDCPVNIDLDISRWAVPVVYDGNGKSLREIVDAATAAFKKGTYLIVKCNTESFEEMRTALQAMLDADEQIGNYTPPVNTAHGKLAWKLGINVNGSLAEFTIIDSATAAGLELVKTSQSMLGGKWEFGADAYYAPTTLMLGIEFKNLQTCDKFEWFTLSNGKQGITNGNEVHFHKAQYVFAHIRHAVVQEGPRRKIGSGWYVFKKLANTVYQLITNPAEAPEVAELIQVLPQPPGIPEFKVTMDAQQKAFSIYSI